MDTTCLEPENPGHTDAGHTDPGHTDPGHDDPGRPGPEPADPEQLTLLLESAAPTRFRLDAATRRRGLRHVAEMRALLAQRRATREASTGRTRLPASPTGAERPSARPDRAA